MSRPVLCALLSFAPLMALCGCPGRDDPAGVSTVPPPTNPADTRQSPRIAPIENVTLPPVKPPSVAPELATAPVRPSHVGPLADAYGRLDPAKDGWQSEVVSEQVSSQLKALQGALAEGAASDTELASLAAAAFRCGELFPNEVATVYEQGELAVARIDSNGAQDTTEHVGAAGLADAVSAWRAQLPAEAKLRVELKPHRIEKMDEGHWATDVTLSAVGGDGKQTLQINDTWRCEWASAEGDKPRLLSITSTDYERCRLAARSALLQDVTGAALAGAAAAATQAGYGVDHWRAKLPRNLGLTVTGNHGLAIGDVNGDELEDLYLCAEGGLPNRLLIRNSDGSVRDASSEYGVDIFDSTSAALFADLDNDLDQDLVIVLAWTVLILENDGQGAFKMRNAIPSRGQLFSVAAADFDDDADLDLFVCGYQLSRDANAPSAMPTPVPFHDADNGAPNLMLRNDDGWEFTACAEEVGLDENNSRFSYAAAWADYDNDGDVDLYVANDFGRNNLYRNDDGKFKDVAGVAGVEDMSAGMSACWGDYNRDGRLDLYVANMFSSAGNRIAYQRQFQPGASEEALRGLRRHARGNSLFQNVDGQAFRDVSVDQGVTRGRWAWCSKFVDLNNDGWEDILSANGFITTPDTGDL